MSEVKWCTFHTSRTDSWVLWRSTSRCSSYWSSSLLFWLP